MSFSGLVVVIAALDEEMGIGPTIREMKDVLDDSRFVVVDGGSKDKTIDVAQTVGAEVFVQKGRGKGDAVRQGLVQLHPDTRYVVFTDADYTYSVDKLKMMLSMLDRNPDVGMVLGDRFSHSFCIKALVNPFFVGNRFFAVVQKILNGLNLNDPLTGLRVVRYALLKGWSPASDGFDIEAELNHYVERMGYRIVEVPISYRRRLGKKKLGLWHGINILKRIIQESVTTQTFLDKKLVRQVFE